MGTDGDDNNNVIGKMFIRQIVSFRKARDSETMGTDGDDNDDVAQHPHTLHRHPGVRVGNIHLDEMSTVETG